MKILHYFLGFPPYRSGGLTKYAFDLMTAQVKDEHEVLAMWPGQIYSYFAEPKIKERKPLEGIRNLELINPLPVSLDEGIVDFDAFTKSCDIHIYITFLDREKPDVIHIHTFMGLHREFIQAANRLEIRTVMTSHDYFGICPKVNLYRYCECCDDDDSCRRCIQCNLAPLSLRKIQIMQSALYRWTKDTLIIKQLRKKHRGQFFSDTELPALPDVNIEVMARKYRELRAFYISMYEAIDLMHFNSTVAESIFRRYIVPKDSKVVSITHRGIQAHTRKHMMNFKKIILYLSPAKPYKGWNVLEEACDSLWAEGENIELRVYSYVQNPKPYMVVNENGFDHLELITIMEEADVLVAPSVWYETFGFTVLEALSFGVPVIVSDRVGAKDIVAQNGTIVSAGNVEDLKNAIISTDLTVNIDVKDWETFLKENYEMYAGRRRDVNETTQN